MTTPERGTSPDHGYAVIYRWRVHPGRENQLVEGWTRVTRAMHVSCGSYGSRLHRAADGTYLAYARWPDAATRSSCSHPDEEGEQMMADAIAEYLEAAHLEIDVDLLAEPRDPKEMA
ncbi:hypothetical protein [Phytoactinopolyspora limicola]|uniref:hypothetical protein n=1 Tax=Phytoactinopolyspora limicola TaxID=2715536 RepID=UPI0014091A6B|nr:hypothetical protein [Phytoactinopolyspora limicola]